LFVDCVRRLVSLVFSHYHTFMVMFYVKPDRIKSCRVMAEGGIRWLIPPEVAVSVHTSFCHAPSASGTSSVHQNTSGAKSFWNLYYGSKILLTCQHDF
jgi:hypothetical protein